MVNRILSRLNAPQKFTGDVLWNLGSFAILAVMGVLINLTITIIFGVSVLGVYNQIYSIYILFSQVAVAGIHLSILRHTPQYSLEHETLDAIILSGLGLTSLTAILTVLLVFFAKSLIGNILGSEKVSIGLAYVLPALFFFAINKVILAFVNARRQMKAYAVFQSLRYLMIYGFLVLFGLLHFDVDRLPLIFSFSEFVLFIILSFVVLKNIRWVDFSKIKKWGKTHFHFGFQAIWGNLITEFNSKVDVLILGIFASDSITGIYSFASNLATGLNQLPIVISAILNPMVTKIFFSKGKEGLESFIKKGIKYSYLGIAPFGLLTFIVFFFISHFWNNPVIVQGVIPFGILTLGFILSSGYQPFQMVLNQTGFPANQSVFMLLVFISSILLNFVFASCFNMIGSALAMALLMLCQVVYLKIFVKKALSIKI